MRKIHGPDLRCAIPSSGATTDSGRGVDRAVGDRTCGSGTIRFRQGGTPPQADELADASPSGAEHPHVANGCAQACSPAPAHAPIESKTARRRSATCRVRTTLGAAVTNYIAPSRARAAPAAGERSVLRCGGAQKNGHGNRRGDLPRQGWHVRSARHADDRCRPRRHTF